ncbi:hypothetical protein T11_17588 [Trichinella zimbabwensis]|uniref:MULE transposase domain-containing protein n=1 Tax=Trichinella zimbabwensis TaxID=268475 RepID=A0A0V1HZX0_9BILA|nr:hypothetical protein T11_17588 [Trichinella zimbabwensis]
MLNFLFRFFSSAISSLLTTCCLLLNTRSNYNLIYEGRVYQLKHTNFEDKQSSIHTNSDVNAVLKSVFHDDNYTAHNCILHKIKKNNLQRRAAEEKKPVLKIYAEEASSTSADLEIAGHFSTYKKKSGKKISHAASSCKFLHTGMRQSPGGYFCENLKVLSEHSSWRRDGSFENCSRMVPTDVSSSYFSKLRKKIFPAPSSCKFLHSGMRQSLGENLKFYLNILSGVWMEALKLLLNDTSRCSLFIGIRVVLHLQTVICDFETALLLAVRGLFPGAHVQGCYFHFCQAVPRKMTELGMWTRYIYERETRKKNQNAAENSIFTVSKCSCYCATAWHKCYGCCAVLFNYFQQVWMTPNKLPLWNVHNRVKITSAFVPLQLLIDKNGSTEVLIQQVTSGHAITDNLWIRNSTYEETQQRMTARV